MYVLSKFYEFHTSYTWKKLSLLFIVAFIVRAIPFYGYLQHKERYHQPDSMDYHICALGLHYGLGLRRLDTKWPIFWRTPGYPLYLATFYSLFGVKNPQFHENSFSQKAALWVQIFFSSLTPVFIFFLAISLIPVIPIAWFLAWFFVVHVGFILASSYLLTEALAVMLFFLYLIFFYKQYRMYGEFPKKDPAPLWHTLLSALFLAAYTWMRPMGQFMAIVTMVLFLFAAIPLKRKILHIIVFGAFFCGSLSPWIVRNYQFTGKIFFWPGSGSYLISFNVPKILRRLTGKSFGECHAQMMKQMGSQLAHDHYQLRQKKSHYFVSQELVGARIAWPWIMQYPRYFIKDWMREVVKTTFDLYGSQLVNFARNTYTFDPLEEFLTEKLADCLYRQPMHWFMRLLCWFEALGSFFIWISIIIGFIFFVVMTLCMKLHGTELRKQMFFVWIKAGSIIVPVLGMTGGFGYARLRMPIEPLLLLLAVTSWYYFLKRESLKE